MCLYSFIGIHFYIFYIYIQINIQGLDSNPLLRDTQTIHFIIVDLKLLNRENILNFSFVHSIVNNKNSMCTIRNKN